METQVSEKVEKYLNDWKKYSTYHRILEVEKYLGFKPELKDIVYHPFPEMPSTHKEYLCLMINAYIEKIYLQGIIKNLEG